MPQSTTLGFHPVIHVPNYMHHYLFTDPRDGWLSWPCWLTDSRRLNPKVVTHPTISLVQDGESLPAETSVLTTMLRRQRKQYKFSTSVSLGGNPRSGITLAMCHRHLVVLPPMGSHSLRKGDEHPAYTPVRIWHTLPFYLLQTQGLPRKWRLKRRDIPLRRPVQSHINR